MPVETQLIESEYNINYGFKDHEHIELLKTQIQQGHHIPIHVYEENSALKIIDGGHSFTAYKELGVEPPIIIKKEFDNNSDKIAFSRHRNLNRLKQSPISYTKSIVTELSLRLSLTQEATISTLTRYSNIRRHKRRYKVTDKDNHNAMVIDKLFTNEPVKPTSFINNYLPLLYLPDWLAQEIDLQAVTASHAKFINKLSSDGQKRQVLNAVKKGELSIRETKRLVDREKNKGVGDWGQLDNWSEVFWDLRAEYDTPEHYVAMTNHPCPFVKEIPSRLIQLYSKEGDLVLDPFCGIATTGLACKEHNRKFYGIDLSERYVNDAMTSLSLDDHCTIKVGDARNTGISSGSIDLIITSPPYYSKIEYDTDSPANLGKNQSYENYLRELQDSLREMYRVLKSGKMCCVVLSKMKSRERTYWIAADLYRLGEEVGFILDTYKVVRLIAWNFVEFIVVFRKP